MIEETPVEYIHIYKRPKGLGKALTLFSRFLRVPLHEEQFGRRCNQRAKVLLLRIYLLVSFT